LGIFKVPLIVKPKSSYKELFQKSEIAIAEPVTIQRIATMEYQQLSF